jgi:uncharacterized protein (DUF58 family)
VTPRRAADPAAAPVAAAAPRSAATAAVPREVLRQVRLIELRMRGLVNTIFGGEYNSVFRGQGMEFSEVRAYQAGDDVRNIDWNVTARSGEAHVKKHVEERELTVLLLVDLSGSEHFGTASRLKAEIVAEIAAVLALTAERNNDRVGLIIFTDRVEHVVPPRKGRRNALRMIRDVLAFQPAGRGTDIGAALDYAARLLRHRGIMFLLSDFVPAVGPAGPEHPWEKSLRLVSRRHDVVPITISDRAERHVPNVGLLVLRDPESGEDVAIDTADPQWRAGYEDALAGEHAERRRIFRRLGVDEVEVTTDGSWIRPLLAFFRRRERLARR